MSNRSLRVNELIMRELNDLLRTMFRDEAVFITITEVDVAPDLRAGRAYYSVLGGEDELAKSERFFKHNKGQLAFHLGKRIILKYMPKLRYIPDNSMERGARMIDLLDEIEHEEGDK